MLSTPLPLSQVTGTRGVGSGMRDAFFKNEAPVSAKYDSGLRERERDKESRSNAIYNNSVAPPPSGNAAPAPPTSSHHGSLSSSMSSKDIDNYVGFANLPNQVYRKSVKKGFEFTLMVVGEWRPLLANPGSVSATVAKLSDLPGCCCFLPDGYYLMHQGKMVKKNVKIRVVVCNNSFFVTAFF